MGRWLSLLAVLLLAGCGTTATVTRKSPPPASTVSTTARPKPKPLAHHSTPHVNNPAQQADPNTTVGCNEVPTGHACKASTNTPSNPNDYPQRNCDTNVVANS